MSFTFVFVLGLSGCRSELGNLAKLGAESIPRSKPSTFLCGNRVKTTPGPGGCTHRAPHGGDAFEVVEVRGWIRWVAGGSNNRDPDFHYYMELDPDNPPTLLSGPRKGDTIPLSLILHPGNLIEAVEENGRREFRHPDNDDVFVGNNLKIEIHGCATGERQGGELRNRTLCRAITNDPATVPIDWVAADDADQVDAGSVIWWPFHPRRPLDFQPDAIAVDDYVRLVGTLWEDDHHGFGRCWDDDDEGGHGWFELHPVDLMGKFDTFAPSPPQSTGQAIAACSAGEVDVDIRPPGPRPAGMAARYEEVIRVNEQTTRHVTTYRDHITVHLDVGERFWAYYRVSWGPPISTPPPPPNRCSRTERCCGSVDPDGTCNGECVPAGRACP